MTPKVSSKRRAASLFFFLLAITEFYRITRFRSANFLWMAVLPRLMMWDCLAPKCTSCPLRGGCF